eukprot:jgi/Mesen1/1459/ME000132S00410
MACLALSLQPVNGPDLLLQTRAWFPPARAIAAVQSFKGARNADAARNVSEDAENERLGDDPLAASSGQVVVGKDNKFRVVYRLVNSVYVLGITSADVDDASINIFDCTTVVNQAVSVMVAACRGIDVTFDKLTRKYTELYLALDAILHGVSAARLGSILAAMHGDGSFLLAPPKPELLLAENKARGANSWNYTKGASIERLANVEVLSMANFELPEATLAAGDAAMAAFAPPPPQKTFEREATPEKKKQQQAAPASGEPVDPFAASDRPVDSVNVDSLTGGGFKKHADTPSDPAAALAGLQVTQTPSKDGAAGRIVSEEGFEGEYGGFDFGDADDAFGGIGGGLLGNDGDAWGGGLDASEFGAAVEEDAFGGGLGGGLSTLLYGPGKDLEAALAGGAGAAATAGKDDNFWAGGAEGAAGSRVDASGAGGASAVAAAVADSKLPALWISEEINAEFSGMALLRVGLEGRVHFRPAPQAIHSADDTELSFRLEGSSGVKRAVVKAEVASSLGDGFFHVRAPPSLEDEMVVLKYRLHPRFTPVPLRVRFHTNRTDDALSLMIQYVANPYLAGPLTDVTFILSLPFSPASIKLNPSAVLNVVTKELRWKVPVIEPKAAPQRLRAQIPIMPDELLGGKKRTEEEKAAEEERRSKELASFSVRVLFSGQGITLSGITLGSAGAASQSFVSRSNQVAAGKFLCTA